jgi:high affinity Mn2+ porin
MPKWFVKAFLVLFAYVLVVTDCRAADLPAFPAKVPPVASLYDWTGFYVGGHMGYAGGNSNWTANPTQAGLPSTSGSVDMTLPIDSFAESGSFFMGLQGGYNYLLANSMVLGVEADASFPAFQDLDGLSIGGLTNFNPPAVGAASYGETVLSFGTLRGRIGYAPGNWLFYVTGGLAWTYDQPLSRRSPAASTTLPCCGDSAGPPARASNCPSHRTGPPKANICGPRIPMRRSTTPTWDNGSVPT